MNHGNLGEKGENEAVDYLEGHGFQIRHRNWRVLEGELDIVAQEGDTIVFVEVKTRRSHKFGYPEESITRKKRERLITAALMYLEQEQLGDVSWRFDLVAIDCNKAGDISRIEHIEDIIHGEAGEYY